MCYRSVLFVLCSFLACGTSLAVDPSTPDSSSGAEFAGQALDARTKNGHFRVTLWSKKQPIPQREIHAWIVRIIDRDGAPVDRASIKFDGGMPDHGHGLPTAPRVTKALGNGKHLIEGVKFSMGGRWVLAVVVKTEKVRDIASFELELDNGL